MNLYNIGSDDLREISFANSKIGKEIASILERAKNKALEGVYSLTIEDAPIMHQELSEVTNILVAKGFKVDLCRTERNGEPIRLFTVSWE